jgi:aspartate carbamoyltransferase catalytic subunit
MGRRRFEEFMGLSESARCDVIKDHAILYAQQFSREQLDDYCRLADAARQLHKTPAGADLMASLLRNRLVLNFFIQPSSRTFLSFSAAQTILGMKRMSVRDVKISSMSKGESFGDSIRTFLSYVDMIVMRHPEADAGAEAYWHSLNSHRRIVVNGEENPIPIVSGGSGSKQHPTQSLLDVYTLQKSFDHIGGIDGKTIMLVGDLLRGRTVRSLSYMMKNYKDVKLIFAAPEKYQMKQDICDFLNDVKIPFQKVASIDEALEEADAIYMTRIQDEWNKGPKAGDHEKANPNFCLRQEHLDRMKKDCCVLHPLPKRDEIDPEFDYSDDRRLVYWRQERNGMWMRVAIIATLFGVGGAILDGLK